MSTKKEMTEPARRGAGHHPARGEGTRTHRRVHAEHHRDRSGDHGVLLTATIVSFTGAISPLAYFLGFLVVLALGMCLVQLARLFPSAGGYFTYVSRTLGSRAGFLTGWAYTFYSPIIAGPILAFFGYILQGSSRPTTTSTSSGGSSR